MKAQKCPICEGKGKMPADFYPDTAGTTEKYVECRSCYGTGIVYVKDEIEHVVDLLTKELKEEKEED